MTLLGHQISLGIKYKAFVLLAFLMLHIVVSLFFVAPGHFSIDEGVYHLMAREFVTTGSLGVWNGYEDFASSELILPTLREYNGSLVSQYPSLYPIIAAPFYWLLGYQGLFLLNALAFIATLAVCFLIAQRLFSDRELSLNACLIFVFTTFAWEYSQAAWPHALSMLFVALAVYFAIIAAQMPNGRSSLSLALAAGVTIGFGTGVRLDIIFALPAVLMPFLFFHPWRPLAGLAVGVGLIPGLAVQSAINLVKFGVPSPFSYGAVGTGGGGSVITPYLPITAAGLAVGIGLWIATRPSGRVLIEKNPKKAALATVVVCAIVLMTPQGWTMASRLANGAYQLLIDFRVRDLAIQEGGLSRSPGGGMVYFGFLKKTFLQSCPYLVALAVPLISLARGKDVRALSVLLLVPASFVIVYSYFSWHGGQAFNLRYFVPTLPFLAILMAYVWRDLSPGFRGPWPRIAMLVCLALFGVIQFIMVNPTFSLIVAQEDIFLTMPLVIATVLAILMAVYLGGGARNKALRGAVGAGMITALAWGGMASLIYDFPRSYMVRMNRFEFSKSIVPLVAADSILFVHYGDPFFGVIETDRVRIAVPRLDDFKSFRSLVLHHLGAGRAVYIWIAPEIEKVLQDRSLLDGLSVEILNQQEGGRLVRLATAPPAEMQ